MQVAFDGGGKPGVGILPNQLIAQSKNVHGVIQILKAQLDRDFFTPTPNAPGLSLRFSSGIQQEQI